MAPAAAAANDDVEESSNGGGVAAITAATTNSPTNPVGKGENGTVTSTITIPQTPQELAAFLAKIDGECPLNNTNNTQLQVAATYQATSVKIPASDKKQVRIPIFVKNSKVKWQIGVDECDVMFSIFQEATSTGQDDEDDGVVFVEPQIVTAISKEEQHEQALLDTSTSSNTSTSSTMPFPALSGEFVINEIPVTIILQFGNEYSWFTPKMISYCVTVTPPPDPIKIQRAKRATEALKQVMTQTTLAQTKINQHQRLVQERTVKVQQVNQIQKEKKANVTQQETVIQASNNQTREMNLLHEKVTLQLQSKHVQLKQQKQQIVDLERQIVKLQQQRLTCLQEKEILEKDIVAGEASAQKLVQRRDLILQEVQQEKVVLRQVKDEYQTLQVQKEAAIKAQNEALQQQQEMAQVLDFLKQLENDLRLRL